MKKIFLIICFFSVIFYSNAQTDKGMAVKTAVSDVTVFIKGAQVTRKTSVNFPAGKSTLRFTNLSPYIDAKSVQVKVDGEVMILSVNHTLNYNDTVKLTDEVAAQAKQIEAIDEKIKTEQTNLEIIAEAISFLKENKKIGGADKGLEYNNLKLTTEYYSQQIAALITKQAETNKKIKTLGEEKAAIQKKIASAGGVKPEPTGEIVLIADCKTALRVPVELSYYVNNASWFPSYDIRAKDITQPVDLVYKANVMQNTKEEWKNVKLKISSANPNLGSVAPKLQTYVLNYWTKPPRYDLANNNLSNTVSGIITDENGEPLAGASVTIKGTTIGTATDLDGKYSLTIPANGGDLQISFVGFKTKIQPIISNNINIRLEEDERKLSEVVVTGRGGNLSAISKALEGRTAGVAVQNSSKPTSVPVPVVQVENATSVEFEIKTPYTIASENKTTVVEMEHYSLPADYQYYCVPKADKDAFLLANIVDWEKYNLLEGEANIFFENTFVGKTILDVRYISDTLNISLGRDKNVVIKREKVTEFTQTKFLSSKAEVTRNWKITVRNNKRQPISMVLLDQIPVSTVSEIEVTAEKLTNGILNKETGEVKWTFTLPPTQKTEFELLYRVRYPKGKNLTIE
ncbi:MAG: mucoidy inhibitor MuiA family protein [Paludibacter sp.]|nr:mucoidy inhibitor MuiA family protein [Paludibacter sp.]